MTAAAYIVAIIVAGLIYSHDGKQEQETLLCVGICSQTKETNDNIQPQLADKPDNEQPAR